MRTESCGNDPAFVGAEEVGCVVGAANVGEMEGLAVGAPVGNALGALLGEDVGNSVGLSLGGRGTLIYRSNVPQLFTVSESPHSPSVSHTT